MRKINRRVMYLLAVLLLPILQGCASKPLEIQIRDVLDRQVAAWNTGNIKGFMDGYWRSEELVFESPKGPTKGWQATLERYQQRYPTKEKMGHLRFSDLAVRPLTPDSAQVTGRWEVQTSTNKAAGGFQLDMRRINGHWVIVKDHTTSDDEKT